MENKVDFVTGLPIGEDGKIPVEGKKMCINCSFWQERKSSPLFQEDTRSPIWK